MPPDEHTRASRREVLWLCVILLFLAAVRFPALLSPINLSQDATEYIDIARNVAAGRGLTLDIRGYFFNDSYGIPYPSQSLRSPFFPLLLGSVYKATGSEHVFAWCNFFLFAVNMVLLALVIRPACTARITALALLLAGLTESLFLTSIFPWAEQTAFFWLLLAMLIAGRQTEQRWRLSKAFLGGLVCAMAGLSRPEYVLAGLLYLAWILWKNRRAAVVVAFTAGLGVPVVLLTLYNLHTYGRTFLPGSYLFHCRDYGQYFSWADSKAPETWSFLKANWFWVPFRVARNLVNYLAKLAGWKNLSLLSVALPAVIIKIVRAKYDWHNQLVGTVGLAFLIAYCMVWSGIDRERYLLAVTPLVLPLCLAELDRWRTCAIHSLARRAFAPAAVTAFLLCLSNVIHADLNVVRRRAPAERFYARENPAWSNPDLATLVDWIRGNTSANDVLCLENPFLINYYTERPGVIIPAGIGPEHLTRFLEHYEVRYLISNRIYTKMTPEAVDLLEKALRDAGDQRAAECGTYRVFRLRRPADRFEHGERVTGPVR